MKIKFFATKLKILTDQFKDVGKDLAELRTENNYLRLAADLPPLSNDESALGIGGSEFE